MGQKCWALPLQKEKEKGENKRKGKGRKKRLIIALLVTMVGRVIQTQVLLVAFICNHATPLHPLELSKIFMIFL